MNELIAVITYVLYTENVDDENKTDEYFKK
jgi:hypothetical protein